LRSGTERRTFTAPRPSSAARTAAGGGPLPPQPQFEAGAVFEVGGTFLAFGLEADGEVRPELVLVDASAARDHTSRQYKLGCFQCSTA